MKNKNSGARYSEISVYLAHFDELIETVRDIRYEDDRNGGKKGADLTADKIKVSRKNNSTFIVQSNNFPREPRFPSKNFYSIRLVYLPLSLSLSLSVYLFILSNCLLQEEQTIPNLQFMAFHRNLHRGIYLVGRKKNFRLIGNILNAY